MTEQKCVRTYHTEGDKAEVGCEDLNSYLKSGWKVVIVTPTHSLKEHILNEYIIEREVDPSREDRLCSDCDQYASCPDGKCCRTCDNGSKWKRKKE